MLIFALLILAATPVDVPAPMPQVQAYASTLKSLQLEHSGESVEKTFKAAVAVREALLQRNDDDTLLESLPDEEFHALTKELPGIIVTREEAVIVEPDPVFFEALAGKYGGAADVEFFRNYHATLPDGMWQSYVEQQTDFSACTAFGNGELVKRYSGWLAFRLKYPQAYSNQVAEQLAAIEQEVAESTCACGTWNEVYRELQAFADAFPTSPVIKQVQKRIRELRASTSAIRFNCISG